MTTIQYDKDTYADARAGKLTSDPSSHHHDLIIENQTSIDLHFSDVSTGAGGTFSWTAKPGEEKTAEASRRSH